MKVTVGQFFIAVMDICSKVYRLPNPESFVGSDEDLINVIFNDWEVVKESDKTLRDAATETAAKIYEAAVRLGK